MTSNARRAAVLEEVLRAALQGDQRALTRLCTDDVKAWTPDRATSSRDELVEELGRREQAFSSADAEVVPLDVGGDFACAEWTVTLTHTGKFELADGNVIEPTGARVTVHGATVAEFSGEQVCALRQYWDELGALEQIAAAAPPPPEGPA
ncbi:MAG TPA: nuclear transport factor 2 family protein [Acidimicrobiales bacterium]|jgi:ketosteroid isomerase-like protein|nr:nuclear transport factor 2 family protein [Acidimicrobiales bacterium]